MPHLINLSNQRFGRLAVLERNGIGPRKGAAWLCLCDCGKKVTVESQSLRSGNTKSCGCLNRENKSNLCKSRNTTHGLSRSPEHVAWVNMRQRCENPNSRIFHNYGGKGITVCERWASFENFLADMGPRPGKWASIDRIDGSKGYTPENCRWSSPWQQQNNRTNNVTLSYNGMTMSLTAWARLTGLSRNAIRNRKAKGWSDEEALSIPAGGKRNV